MSEQSECDDEDYYVCPDCWRDDVVKLNDGIYCPLCRVFYTYELLNDMVELGI